MSAATLNSASTHPQARAWLNRRMVPEGCRAALACLRNAMNSVVTDCSSGGMVSRARSIVGSGMAGDPFRNRLNHTPARLPPAGAKAPAYKKKGRVCDDPPLVFAGGSRGTRPTELEGRSPAECRLDTRAQGLQRLRRTFEQPFRISRVPDHGAVDRIALIQVQPEPGEV